MIFEKDVQRLLNNPTLNEIEHEIATKVNSSVDYSPMLINVCEKEISDSNLSIEKIENYIIAEKDLVISFGVKLLIQNGSPQNIGHGVSVTYAIYLIYLDEHKEKLLEYIQKRRIPKPKKVVAELIEIRDSLHTKNA